MIRTQPPQRGKVTLTLTNPREQTCRNGASPVRHGLLDIAFALSATWSQRRAGSPWRVFTDQTVDRLAKQVSVADMPGIFLVQIDEHPSGVRCPVRVEGDPHRPVKSAVGKDLGNGRTASRRRVAPELVELLG